jgi:hypothetical protein
MSAEVSSQLFLPAPKASLKMHPLGNEGMFQVVEHLPSKHKALSSNSTIDQKKNTSLGKCFS